MVKNRISSQYVFGYQKFILYPEDYKTTKTGKKKVSLPELVGKGYGTFGVGRADIEYVRVHVHPRSQRQLHFGISPT